MFKIVSTVVLVLVIALFPPSALAFISNSALPDDKFRYPIKRKLEDGILLIAGIHPSTRAWFAVSRSQRRYLEAAGLLDKGEDAKVTLEESISQTTKAIEDINQINDTARKQTLALKLLKQMEEYDKSLNQVEKRYMPTTTTFSQPPAKKSITNQPTKTTPTTTTKTNQPITSTSSTQPQVIVQRVIETRVEIVTQKEIVKEIIIQSGGDPNTRTSPNPQFAASPSPNLTPSPTIPSPSPSPRISPSPSPVCGDQTCQSPQESCFSCPTDCGSCRDLNPAARINPGAQFSGTDPSPSPDPSIDPNPSPSPNNPSPSP